MGIDWEDLLGDDVDLGQAYEEHVAEAMEKLQNYEKKSGRPFLMEEAVRFYV